MKKLLYGIQKKLLLYVMLLILLILALVAIGVSSIAGRSTKENLIRQNTYVNDKLYQVFQGLYSDLETVSENCISNEYVQKSLKNKELSVYEREIISRTLGFLGGSLIDYSIYIDNKENIYSNNKIELDFATFYNSRIYQGLGEEYSKLKLFWERDFLSGRRDMALFAGRYVRQFDRNHAPGALYIKVDDAVLDDLFFEVNDLAPAFYLLDGGGQICYRSYDEDFGFRKDQKLSAEQEMAEQTLRDGLIYGSNGIFFGKEHKETGFWIVTFVPNQMVHQVVFDIIKAILIIFAVTIAAALLLSHYFSKRFTKPIRYISSLMETFDDSHLNQTASLSTNTELDDIGRAYNRMLKSIQQLLNQVRSKEKELWKAELDTLLYQIQPHFLYNTLDTIYMLARISKEQTIMKMIQSLSKYLRINLSNGAKEIPIHSELENIKAYMEIQKIRKDGLFDYTMEWDASVSELLILKMILQPVVENAIKHGFCDMEEKGEIAVMVKEIGGEVVFSVENNGAVMEEKDMERLNRLQDAKLTQMDQLITSQEGGYGIRNVVKRLRLRYGDGVRFYYVRSANKTTCILKIAKDRIERAKEDEREI